MKPWVMIAMAGALLGAVSCTPVGNSSFNNGAGPGRIANGGAGIFSGRGNQSSGVPAGSAGSGARATVGELKKLREQREAAGGERLIAGGGSSGSGAPAGYDDEGPVDPANLPPLPPISIDYRYAMPVPGRKGWVYNPFTNRPVDVRGVESGRLIYDERDPENRNSDGTLKAVSQMPNKFRVP